MKNIILILTAVCFFAISCQKNETIPVAESPSATLTVSIVKEVAKSSSEATSAETALDPSKIFLFVFKADGSREVGQAVTLDEGGTTVNVTAGAKTVWVTANCPSTVLEATTLAAFRTKVSVLSDNASMFVMAGSASKTINGDDNVSVTLKRLASKVVLVSLKRDFTDPDYAFSILTVNRIYLSNVCGECRYYSDDTTPTAADPVSVTTWYNRLGVFSLTASDPSTLLCATVGADMANGSSYTDEQVMYAYPNAGSPHTRLVVDCSLAGTQGFYSVSLPVMESNKVYNVSLTLHKKPSSSPEDNGPEINPALSFTASIIVSGWDDSVDITENL